MTTAEAAKLLATVLGDPLHFRAYQEPLSVLLAEREALREALRDLLGTISRERATHPEEDDTYTVDKWAIDAARAALGE